jgi:hypothetical protein
MYTMQKTLMLLVFAAAFATAPMATADNSSQAAPSKFVGTFYVESGGVTTIHSDGTVSVVLADMFNAADRRATPSQGVWRKVGHNKIQVTTIAFITEAFGDNYRPNGFTVKSTWLSTFDDPVQGVSPGYNTVFIAVELFLPDQNPITDDPVAVVARPDTRGYRLTVE